MSDDYFVGVNSRELERLKGQHESWKPETTALWAKAGFTAGLNILDAGCGPGFTSLELAQIVGSSGKICALDKATEYLQHLESAAHKSSVANISIATADITVPGSLSGTFDAVFTRWFLAFLTNDLETVLTQIHRVLRPKGIFASMEYLTLRSTTSSPPSLGFDAHTKAWIDYYLRNGGDTEVGALLPSMLSAVGFKIKSIDCVGGMAGPGHRWWNWWFRLIQEFGGTLVKSGLMTTEQLDSLHQDALKFENDPSAFIYTPILVQIVAEKC